MKNKEVSFQKLIANEDPRYLEALWEEADIFSWKSEGLFVSLSEENIIKILERYLAYELTARNVEDWANFIEAADVALGGICNDKVKEVIYTLASPAVEGELSPQLAEKIIYMLDV